MRTISIRVALAICLLAAAAPAVHAQGDRNAFIEPAGFSIGMNLGETDLWGDVGTQKIVDHYKNSFNDVKFMGGLFAKYTVHPCLAIRAQIDYGTLYAADKWNKDLAKAAKTEGDDAFQRYSRYQDIKDKMWEGSLIFEFTPFRTTSDAKISYKVGQPYILAGLSYFHYTPYSSYYPSPASGTKEFIPIANLHLEGDGFGAGYPAAISYWQFAVPLGVGYRWDIGQHFNMGLEYVYRVTFTDYLDGVSGKYIDPKAFSQHLTESQAATAEQMADKSYVRGLLPANQAGNMRGNPGNNDSYSTISIILYYKVKNRSKPWWGDWFY